MLTSLRQFVDRVLSPLPAYLFILAGMTLLGLALLMPAWMDTRELAWRRDLMRAQAEALAKQETNYRQFNEALASDDPVLLERLAFYHLRLKPAGSDTLSPQQPLGTLIPPANIANNARGRNTATTGGAARATPRNVATEVRIPTIDEMLRRPVPRAGVDTPAYQPVKTRLVLLTTGPMRLVVLAGAILCLITGLTSPVAGMKPEDEAYAAAMARRDESIQTSSAAMAVALPGAAAGAMAIDEDAGQQEGEVVGELDATTEVFNPVCEEEKRGLFEPVRERFAGLAARLGFGRTAANGSTGTADSGAGASV